MIAALSRRTHVALCACLVAAAHRRGFEVSAHAGDLRSLAALESPELVVAGGAVVLDHGIAHLPG